MYVCVPYDSGTNRERASAKGSKVIEDDATLPMHVQYRAAKDPSKEKAKHGYARHSFWAWICRDTAWICRDTSGSLSSRSYRGKAPSITGAYRVRIPLLSRQFAFLSSLHWIALVRLPLHQHVNLIET
jgi:hypothetical protein